jgi:hypothetical protein
MALAEMVEHRRWCNLVDEVVARAEDGDIERLLEFVGDQCNACDYVDDEAIAKWKRAMAAVSVRQQANRFNP